MNGGLIPALTRLELALAESGDPLAELARLAGTADLPLLLQVLLRKLVRTGPAADPAVLRRLVAVAQEAAASGIVPLATPGVLRGALEALAGRLRDAGAWVAERPLWWSPLPEPTILEELWHSLGRPVEPLVSLPARDQQAAAFGGPPAPPLRRSLPSFLAPALTGPLHRELEAAFRRGELGLERAGVGASDRISARRSDRVRYVSGREPELLRAAPRLAALVQWGLEHLAGHLAAALPGRRVFPPQNAMLARYPAPSVGYAPHLDNPGGDGDNGRTLTLVIYLNGPGRECAGGEIALWAAGAATTEPPAEVLPATGGSAALFDARAVPHQVRPLAEGPARWALTFWLADEPRAGAPPPPLPGPTVTEALLPIADPPLTSGVVLFHELDDRRPAGRIVPRAVGRARPRVGLVATVYRGGADLDAWCEHHLALGADHLALIFDHLEEPPEAADAERLGARHAEELLTIWSGRRVAAERWPALPLDRHRDDLLRFARSGSSSHAVAARQTLNAGAALEAARTEELGGAPLDWLIHLDADELFHLEGAGRGGAVLRDHFAAASAAGLALVRYVNHELLPPRSPGAPPRFKLNPRLAAARLGPGGWAQMVAHLGMAQTDARPYFHGYFNGKSAVAVAAAAAVAGVHGWSLRASAAPDASRFLAGPSVLHFHFASATAFRRKYLAIVASPLPAGPRLFEPCPAEEAALELIRSLREAGAGEAALGRRLDQLHHRLTTFSETDVELLEEAGLVLCPKLEHPLGLAARPKDA